MNTPFIFFVFLFLFSKSVFSEEIAVHGIVKASDTQTIIPGANIIIKESFVGTITDRDGAFVLYLSAPSVTITVSHIGYAEQEAVITQKTRNITIVLDPIVYELQEFIVKPVNLRKIYAYAIPLEGITIDGQLNDWPYPMAEYPISTLVVGIPPDSAKTRKNLRQTISFDEDTGAPPLSEMDFLGTYRVGYNAKAGLLYVGVTVVDESRIVHPQAVSHSFIGRHDGMAIFLDADIKKKADYQKVKDAQRYVMVPGKGFYSGSETNPALTRQDKQPSDLKGVYFNSNRISTYEWAIPVYDIYPKKQTIFSPQKVMGFELAVKDADTDNSFNWISWTPLATVQGWRNSFNFGMLSIEPQVGWISGCVIDTASGKPLIRSPVFLVDSKECKASVLTDSRGQFRTILPPGRFSLRALGTHFEGINWVEAEVKAGMQTEGLVMKIRYTEQKYKK